MPEHYDVYVYDGTPAEGKRPIDRSAFATAKDARLYAAAWVKMGADKGRTYISETHPCTRPFCAVIEPCP